jgi:type I restriction enzyme S subunit
LLEDLENCYLNSFCALFRFSKSKRPNPVFTGYLLRQPLVRGYFTKKAQGSTRFNLSKDAFRSLPFFVPPPAEQQKIAECLSSVDELMAAQARKVDALKIHKKGLMQQLFPREGETQPRLRFPEFQNAGVWVPKTLVDACRMQAGKFVAAADIKEQNAGELFPCYGGNGLRGFTATFTHDGVYPLIGRQGALCGNVKLASGQFHATEHAVVATPNQGVEAVWLYYLLDLLNLNRFATGQAQPGLSVDVLEKVPVTIPKDESEQHRIASCLSSLDTLITAETRKLEALKTHKKGLMQQLFPSPDSDHWH